MPGPRSGASDARRVRRLMVERNVFRGQMISFGESRMGHMTLGPIVFHRRPSSTGRRSCCRRGCSTGWSDTCSGSPNIGSACEPVDST